MKELTDSQIIALYLKGNQKAFEALINRYSQNIYSFSLKILNSKEEAHDVTQETIIKVWKNIKKFTLTKSFKTWIFTIARRTTLDYLRKRKNVNFSTLNNNKDENENTFEENISDEEPLAEELFEKEENINIVQKALDSIPVDNKTIILLKHGEEMTFEEIAEILEKPMNTVKSQYRRAMITLKERLEKSFAPKL